MTRNSTVIRHTPCGAPSAYARHGQQDPNARLGGLLKRVREENATLLSIKLVACITRMENALSLSLSLSSPSGSSNTSTCTPTSTPSPPSSTLETPLRNRLPMDEWIGWARQVGIPGAADAMIPWYLALRLLVLSWETADWGAVCLLRLANCDQHARVHASWKNYPPVLNAITAFWSIVPSNMQALFRLRRELVTKFVGSNSAGSSTGGNRHEDKGKVIVVTDLPPLTQAVMFFLNDEDAEKHVLKKAGMRPGIAYSPEEADDWYLPTAWQDVHANIEAFRTGEINVLLTTRSFLKEIESLTSDCFIINLDSAVWWDLKSGPTRVHSASSSGNNGKARNPPSASPSGSCLPNSGMLSQVAGAGNGNFMSSRGHPSYQAIGGGTGAVAGKTKGSNILSSDVNHAHDGGSGLSSLGGRKLISSRMQLGPELLEPDADGVPVNEEARQAVKRMLNMNNNNMNMNTNANMNMNMDVEGGSRASREGEKLKEKRHADVLTSKNKNHRSTVLLFASAVGATVDVKHMCGKNGTAASHTHTSIMTFKSRFRHIEVKGFATSPLASEANAAEKLLRILRTLIIH